VVEPERPLGAYLSRGAPRSDGVELRFVTLRSWGLGQTSADARFDRMLALAAELGLPLRNRLREYTVYDSDCQRHITLQALRSTRTASGWRRLARAPARAVASRGAAAG
jgi:hypothetical protein